MRDGGERQHSFPCPGLVAASPEELADASQSIRTATSAGRWPIIIRTKSADSLARSRKCAVALQFRDENLQKFTETLQDRVQKRTLDLRQALSAAEDASRTKSLFLANMSHELRTPLNGVIGMVDLLLAAEPNAQQRAIAISPSPRAMLLDLINDILDFSKIEAGKLGMETADFDFHEVIESVAGMFGERAEQKKIELICGLGQGCPTIGERGFRAGPPGSHQPGQQRAEVH